MNVIRNCARGRLAVFLVIAAGSTLGTALAQDNRVDSRDLLYWQATVGVGSAQSAELILDNTRCEAYASGDIYINEDQGLGQRIPFWLAPGTSLVVPVAGPSIPGVGLRRLLAVRVHLAPGPCGVVGRFRASGVVVNPDQTTDGVFLMLSPLPAGEHRLTFEPAATRLGPGQNLEYAVWNGCPIPIVVELETADLLTGDVEKSTLQVDPLRIGAVTPIIGDSSQVRVVGFGTFSVRRGDASANAPCPPGHGVVAITPSLVNADGTTQASGLPTGKRQHHPVSLAKPISEDEDED